MELSSLIAAQISADEKRGFPVKFEAETEKRRQLEKELVGLLGEIGEFANLTKKVGLKLDNPAYAGPSFSEAKPALREELADSLIYLFRISAILEIDVEQALLEKMSANAQRYKPLE